MKFFLLFPAVFANLLTPSTIKEDPALPEPEPVKIEQVVAPLADLIGAAESGTAGGYDAANRGRPYDLGRDGVKKVFGKPAAEVLVSEIRTAQRYGKVSAVGRYQIIGITLQSLLNTGCLQGSESFDKATQDKAFICLIQQKRPAIWRFITTGNGIVPAANATALEWASMPYSHGGSYYGGWNASRTTRNLLFTTLEETRQNVIENPGAI